MLSHGAFHFGGKTAGVVGCVELYVVDRYPPHAQRLCKVPHSSEHQHNLLLVMANIGAFLLHLHHQHDVVRWIEVTQRRQIGRELITEHDPQGGHNGVSLRCGMVWCGARRQRWEQYFTFSQSRDHFLRQVKGRQQVEQILTGSSAF